MTAALKNLANTVIQLSPQDRAFLAEQLLRSLDKIEMEEVSLKELKRRRDEICSGKVKAVPAEEVYRRVEQLLKK